MEKKCSRSREEMMGNMIEALRAEPSGNAPVDLVSKMLAAPTKKEIRFMPMLRLGVAASLAVTGILVLWPRESPAAMLERVAQAANSNVLRHEYNYRKDEDGEFVLWMESYAQGGRWRLISRNAESAVTGNRRLTYYKGEGYAVAEAAESQTGEMFGAPSLKRLLALRASDKISVKHNVSWQGRKVDFFLTVGTVTDAQGKVLKSVTKLYADPVSDRPLYLEGSLEGFEDMAIRWEYPDYDPRLFAVTMPSGIPVYDLEAQRKQALEIDKQNLGTQTIGGIKVTLHGVYVAHDGSVLAITSGGTGRDSRSSVGIEIEGVGRPNSNEAGPVMEGSGSHDGYLYSSVEYRGKRLVSETGKFATDVKIPDRFKISIPIWKSVVNSVGVEARELAGYAKFDVAKPVRTASLNMLFAPVNVSIFRGQSVRQPSSSGQRTTPVQ